MSDVYWRVHLLADKGQDFRMEVEDTGDNVYRLVLGDDKNNIILSLHKSHIDRLKGVLRDV